MLPFFRFYQLTDCTLSGQTITATTFYIGGTVYESKAGYTDNTLNYTNKLLHVAHEEGRIRTVLINNTTPSYSYDYFLKDHLGNVRIVLTDEQRSAVYPVASMETGTAPLEETYYTNLDVTRTATPPDYPEQPGDTTKNKNVAKITAKQKVGPSILLKVTAGDKFNIKVNSWYRKQVLETKDEPIENIVGALVNILSAPVIGAISGKANQRVGAPNVNGTAPGGLTEFLKNQDDKSQSNGKPKAYLNWIFYDEQMKVVEQGSGFDQVGEPGKLKTHVKEGAEVAKSGYLYVYTSNTTSGTDVYFDQLTVQQVYGPVLEENHYYPFGLAMTALNWEAAGNVGNKYKFNSIEQNNNFDLNLYDAFFRTLDPQIGKWWQIDPKCEPKEDNDEVGLESLSPYNSMSNNPISLSDPLGDEVKNEYKIVLKGGEVVSTTMTGTKGGNQKDYITVVNMDRAPYADGVKTIERDVAKFPTSGPGNNFDAAQKENPTPGYREFHNKSTELATLEWLPIGRAGKATTLLGAAKKYTISNVKEALKKVYKELGTDGGLPKAEPGKFRSPQRSNGTKGYRLDPAHPNKPLGHPESVPHINWWDRTNGAKRGKGLREDAVPILNP